MLKLAVIAAGGAIGALLRYGLVGAVFRLTGSGFPWGTLTVNVLGSAVIGFLWAIAERTPLTPAWSAFLFIGVLGAFTTFSTFALETTNLFREGHLLAGLANVALSNLTCIAFAVIGLWLGRLASGT